MHRSWSPLLLFTLVPSAQAAADNEYLYRVVVFDGVLHSTQPGNLLGQNLATWPLVSAGGDGLRFRFCGDRTVIGTTSVSESGMATLSDLRGAAWRIGTTTAPIHLPIPAGAVGSVATDANDDGTIVGGIIGSSGGVESVQAAAWSYSEASLSGAPYVSTAFQGIVLGQCFDQLPPSLLTAVGPRDSSAGRKAMVAGTAGIVNGGFWNDGFWGAITANGEFSDIGRLPGVADTSWCESWPPIAGKRCVIVPCVAWNGSTIPANWSSCTAIGSRRNTTFVPTEFCFDSQKWDFYLWNIGSEKQLIDNCRGCDGNALEPCVSIGSSQPLIYETVTDLRLGAFAPDRSSLLAAYAGVIQVRSSTPDEICDETGCSQAHAAVVTAISAQDPSAMRLWDLHSVLQAGRASDGVGGSAIARILHEERQTNNGPEARWLAVGAVSNDPDDPNLSGSGNGYIWVGKAAADTATDWCAWNVNAIAICPSGMVVESVHDMNDAGIAIATVSSTRDGNPVLRLAFLTPVADINGDLKVDGGDLGVLLGDWGPVQSFEERRLHDLNQDGNINGADLGLFLGGWGDYSGEAVRVWIACQGQPWSRPLERLPYIQRSSELLGFSSLDELGETTRRLSTDEQVGLCSVVNILADALEETR